MAWGKAFEDLLAPDTNTDKVHTHRYHIFYDELFHPWREIPIKVLEYGIDMGFSLRMWAAYFRNAQVIGVDVKDCSDLPFGNRIRTIVGDMRDREFIEKTLAPLGPFDLIVDDGSHLCPDQRNALVCSWPFVKPGGYYVIEDIYHDFAGQCGLIAGINPRRFIDKVGSNFAKVFILQK